MQFLPLYIASILATLVAAAPLSGCRISTITTEVVEKRGQADLETYDGDECTGNSWGLVMLAGPDTYRCVAMSNAKSIRIANS
jgi:hypothetical protein